MTSIEVATCESPQSWGSKASDSTQHLSEVSPVPNLAHSEQLCPNAVTASFRRPSVAGRFELLSESEKKAVGVLQGLLPVMDAHFDFLFPDVSTSNLEAVTGQRRRRDAGSASAAAATNNDDEDEEDATPAVAPRRKKMRSASRGVAAAAAAAASWSDDGGSPAPARRSGGGAGRGARGPSTAWRRKSNCHYCEPLGLNCGLVAGKCPNRPCLQCGQRHRLGRCRRSSTAAQRSSSNSSGTTAANITKRQAAVAAAQRASKAKAAAAAAAPVFGAEEPAAPVPVFALLAARDASSAPGSFPSPQSDSSACTTMTTLHTPPPAEASASTLGELLEADLEADALSVPSASLLAPRRLLVGSNTPKEAGAAGRLAPRLAPAAAAAAAAAVTAAPDGACEESADEVLSDDAAVGARVCNSSTVTRKRSACHFCKQMGANCGLVAGKCPNRPCFECGGRHRHGRCRTKEGAAPAAAAP